MQSFVGNAPKYNGNLEKMFEWCKSLETHLINYKWETIPDKDVRSILYFCFTGSARKEIGRYATFKNNGVGEFFGEMVRRVSPALKKWGKAGYKKMVNN